MLSEKYIAGFLDADGCVNLQMHQMTNSPQLRMGFSQKTSQDKVLYLIQEAIGGSIREVTINNVNYSHLTICGKTAINGLNRIKKYLVIKRHFVDVCLDLANKSVSDKDAFKSFLKEQRRCRSLPLPNFPTRKWLAGYIDGDGCFSVGRISPIGSARPILHIAASVFDTEGIEIIQKNFGGAVHDMCEGRVRQYILWLSPSKAVQFLNYFCEHLITKYEQAKFILGCAEMGNYRDGECIKSALKQLKAHGHRLNEPKVDLSSFLTNLRDLPPRQYHRSYSTCKVCGTDVYQNGTRGAKGFCSICYQKNYRKEMSEKSTYAIVGAAA